MHIYAKLAIADRAAAVAEALNRACSRRQNRNTRSPAHP